jgi:hypothetical protein
MCFVNDDGIFRAAMDAIMKGWAMKWKKNDWWLNNKERAKNIVPMDNLRLETSPDCFYVLSYHHVELAKFESAQDGETITMFF